MNSTLKNVRLDLPILVNRYRPWAEAHGPKLQNNQFIIIIIIFPIFFYFFTLLNIYIWLSFSFFFSSFSIFLFSLATSLDADNPITLVPTLLLLASERYKPTQKKLVLFSQLDKTEFGLVLLVDSGSLLFFCWACGCAINVGACIRPSPQRMAVAWFLRVIIWSVLAARKCWKFGNEDDECWVQPLKIQLP